MAIYVKIWTSEATPSATHFFKRSRKISHPPDHRLRTPIEELAFAAWQKIHNHSQIFTYGRSTFCLPYQPNFSDIFDSYLHWVSVVCAPDYKRPLMLWLALQHHQKVKKVDFQSEFSIWIFLNLNPLYLLNLCSIFDEWIAEGVTFEVHDLIFRQFGYQTSPKNDSRNCGQKLDWHLNHEDFW